MVLKEIASAFAPHRNFSADLLSLPYPFSNTFLNAAQASSESFSAGLVDSCGPKIAAAPIIAFRGLPIPFPVEIREKSCSAVSALIFVIKPERGSAIVSMTD